MIMLQYLYSRDIPASLDWNVSYFLEIIMCFMLRMKIRKHVLSMSPEQSEIANTKRILLARHGGTHLQSQFTGVCGRSMASSRSSKVT